MALSAGSETEQAPSLQKSIQHSIAMVNIAASGMSVEAARLKPMHAALAAVMSAASTAAFGRNLRTAANIANTIAVAEKAEGRRAAQSLTPNILYASIASQ